MAIYQRCRGFDREQIQLAVRVGLKLGASELQVQRSNCTATPPPEQPSKAFSRKYVVKLITCFWNRF